MRLIYKINLVALGVLILVGCAIAAAGLLAIDRITYDLNGQIMAREVDKLVGMAAGYHDILTENRIDHVASYVQKAQSDLLAELRQYHYGRTGRLMVLNADGTVVLHPVLAPGQRADLPFFAEMAAAAHGTLERPYRGETRFFSFGVFPQWRWLVVLSVHSAEITAVRTRFLEKVGLILLASLVGGIIVFGGITSRVVKPIRRLAAATEDLSQGRWEASLPAATGSDEVAQLTEAFRDMAGRLATLYSDLTANLEQVEASRAALRHSERKHRELVELLPEVVFETDRRGLLVFANSKAFTSFDHPRQALGQGLTVFDLLAPPDRPRARDSLRRILAGETLGMMEFSAQKRDGSTFPALVLASAIAAEGGQSAGLRGILVDITERKAMEDRLSRAQRFLQNILNNVADPIFVKDSQHRWILLNDAFCRFVGNRRERLLGRSAQDVFPVQEAQLFHRRDAQVFASGQPSENEETLTDASGRRHVLLVMRTVFQDADGQQILVGSVKDITEHKAMEQERLKGQKIESLGVLAGGIAHDFNNILTAVIGNLSLAKDLARPEAPLYRNLVETEKAAARARDLTQQLLTFSRGGAPVKRTVSLGALITDSVTFVLRGSNVRCDFAVAGDLWPAAVDEGQFSQVLSNLTLNACQAMPDGGVVHLEAVNQVLTAADAHALPPGRYIRLSIRDQGIGIAAEHLPKIFDPYYTTKPSGNGLGLATAYSIISRHGGRISVDSRPGAGAAFHILLPASEERIEITPTAAAGSVPAGAGGRILVMDDEAIVREVVGPMLRHLGFTVDLACDGHEALERYRAGMEAGRPYDAIIMDLTIPGGMGGKEAIGKLLALDPGARAIVSSGYSSDPVMADFAAYGFAGVVAKPFDLAALGGVLDKVLDLHR